MKNGTKRLNMADSYVYGLCRNKKRGCTNKFFSLSLDTRDKYQPIFRIYELVLTKYPGYWPLIIIHPEITNII